MRIEVLEEMQEIVSKTRVLYQAAFAKCLPLLEMSPQQQMNSIMPLFVAADRMPGPWIFKCKRRDYNSDQSSNLGKHMKTQ